MGRASGAPGRAERLIALSGSRTCLRSAPNRARSISAPRAARENERFSALSPRGTRTATGPSAYLRTASRAWPSPCGPSEISCPATKTRGGGRFGSVRLLMRGHANKTSARLNKARLPASRPRRMAHLGKRTGLRANKRPRLLKVFPDPMPTTDNPLLSKLETLPAQPGCYLFKDKKGEVVYVG